MPTLHDRGRRTALLERIAVLRPDGPRQWGTMTAAQMLHHLNCAMELTIGRLKAAPKPVHHCSSTDAVPGGVCRTTPEAVSGSGTEAVSDGGGACGGDGGAANRFRLVSADAPAHASAIRALGRGVGGYGSVRIRKSFGGRSGPAGR